MDTIFSKQICWNLDFYIDYMVITTPYERWHIFEGKFGICNKIQYALKPKQILFWCTSWEVYGFQVNKTGIEATLDNFQVIRDMRSQTLVKEVLRLGVRITILP